MDFIRPIVKRLRRILKRDETPSWIYKEKRQSQAALKQFLARRTVDSRTKKETLLPMINNLNANRSTSKVKLLNLYPDLTDFK